MYSDKYGIWENSVRGHDAPRRFVRSTVGSCYVTLTKRVGHITSGDFLEYANRFISMCDNTSQDKELVLRRRCIGQIDREVDEMIDFKRMNNSSFREIFMSSSMIVLNILSKTYDDDIDAFGQIAWRSSDPKTILFSAQQDNQFPQTHPLNRKMLGKSLISSINFAINMRRLV